MFFRYNRLAMLLALIILILCGMPGRDIPHISFLELLSFDKFVHASLFFILTLLFIRGFLLQFTFDGIKRNARTVAFIVCAVYGGALEIMQGTVCEGRSADIFDFIADSVGCGAALIFYGKMEDLLLAKLIKPVEVK